jgi:hypothetical protein
MNLIQSSQSRLKLRTISEAKVFAAAKTFASEAVKHT